MSSGAIIAATMVASLLIIIWWCTREGFRTQEKKLDMAKQLVAFGEPKLGPARALGFDGAEFYRARQLWHAKKFTVDRVSGLL